jgi:trafficking protein particle complex subunit 9
LFTSHDTRGSCLAQVDLQLLRSFYKEAQKSPFKFFPWKTGKMHFRFVAPEAARRASPLAALHTYRKILGVIGIVHCPCLPDIRQAYNFFEQLCRCACLP